MGAEDGHFGAEWKRSLRGRALLRGALDLILPRETLDGETVVGAQGLSAEAWMRIHFLDGPVCDGCGQHVGLITKRAWPYQKGRSRPAVGSDYGRPHCPVSLTDSGSGVPH